MQNTQQYKISRITLISYKGQKRKELNNIRCRYLAKSKFVRVNSTRANLEYVNFRGTQFSKVKFSNSRFYGCDFWGTKFIKCKFYKCDISNSIFVSCVFSDCEFIECNFKNTIVVTTNMPVTSDEITLFKEQPSIELSDDLIDAIQRIKENKHLTKNKLLRLNGNRLNRLNIYLLLKEFTEKQLCDLLLKSKTKSFKKITTYKKLEIELKKMNDML